MQILINISEEHFKTLQMMKDVGLGCYHEAILNGQVFSEDITNGDVLSAFFPDAFCEVRECVVIFEFGGVKRELPIGWWNAKYKSRKRG